MAEYSNAPQERGYQVLLALAGNEFHGAAPGEIAKAIGTSASNVTRDLRVLQKCGLAEPLADSGLWRLGPKIVQISLAFTTNLDRQRRRFQEVEQRYTREPT